MPAPQLIVQTTYAELLERCAATAFGDAFPEDGSFTSKTIGGRLYWYFQAATSKGRKQRYVGPESPALLARIAHHKQNRDDERERRSLVSTLVRSYGLPAPPAPSWPLSRRIRKSWDLSSPRSTCGNPGLSHLFSSPRPETAQRISNDE